MGPEARSIRRDAGIGNHLEFGRGETLQRSAEGSVQDSAHVDVDGAHPPAKGESGNGTGRIRTDAGQPFQGLDVIWNLPIVVPNDGDRCESERNRAPVVAQTSPGPEDGRGRCLGEGLDRRKLDQEPGPELRGPPCLRLLGHGLGNKNRVRISGPAEREITATIRIPVEDRVAELRRHGPRRDVLGRGSVARGSVGWSTIGRSSVAR